MRELREIRLRRGLSQADLSAKTGVAEFTISEIESGKRANPRPSTLRKLAHALDVEVADLYGDREHPLGEVRSSPAQLPLNGFEDERLANWRLAVADARRLRDRGGPRMAELLAAWHASKERQEAAGERRVYLDEMGALLQEAYDAETALLQALEGQLGPDQWSDLQEASRFYGELRNMVNDSGLKITEAKLAEDEATERRKAEISVSAA